MSNSRNFSISINLCMWFHDHRQRARIFINDDIQTVRDLEKHIEKIFKIKNLFLTSGNEFLPSSEDVRILQQNDVVWVMPETRGHESAPKTTPVVTSTTYNIETKKRSASAIEQDIDPPKKKKKKKHDPEEDVKYINPSKESKKKKKHIVDKISTVESQVDVIMDIEQAVVKDKKTKKKALSNSTASTTSDTPQEKSHSQNKNNSMNINQLLPVLQNHIESYNKKKILKANETATTSISSESSFGSPPVLQNNSQFELFKDTKESYTCKGTLSSYKKKMSIPTITDKYLKEKKINIVKIEYLSGKKSDLKRPEPSKCNDTVDRGNGENSTCLDDPKVTDTTTTLNLTSKHKTCTSNDNPEDCMIRSTMESEEPPKFSIDEEECFENRNITASASFFKSGLDENTSKSNYTAVADENLIKSVDIPQMSNKNLNNTTTEKEMKNANSIKLAGRQLSPFVQNLSPLRNLETLTKPDNYDPKNSERSSNISENANTVEKSIEINDEKNICESIPCGTKPESSNECSLTNSSATVVEVVMNSAIKKYETGISQAPLNQTLENNVSDAVDCTVNEDLENFTKELQRNDDVLPTPHLEELKVNSLAAKTDTFKENVSLVHKKETTTNASAKEEMINSSDSSKDSEIDLTKDEETSDKLSRTNNGNSSIFSKRKHISGIGQLLGELRNNESLVTGESMDSDYSEFITKRKRKRVRKRKKKNKETASNTFLNDSSILISPDCEPKPVKSRACPTMHLKFEEDEDLKVVDVQKEVQTGQENESYGDIPNITIDSDVEESNFVNFNIKEEYILKSPSIKNLLPKDGDIIAFKILRITENYTPDVSPYIIGKVEEYKTESKAVLYEILHGMEYCQDPKGLLYVEEAQENTKCNRREYPWTDMIDPRLLFP